MTSRERLIAQGLLQPRKPLRPGDPTPQAWRNEPTLRMTLRDHKRARKEATTRTEEYDS